jgi:hypothetical protein
LSFSNARWQNWHIDNICATWVFYCFQRKISKNSYDVYSVPSVEAMVCMVIERLKHMLLPISHGTQGTSKWEQ